MEAILIFKAASAVKAIAAYFEIIESVDSNVQKLIQQSFRSAVMNLEYAKDCPSSITQKDYILQAKNEFIRAIAVEKDENLVSSYIGLAMCQFLLDDKVNAQKSLAKIDDIKLSSSERNKCRALDLAMPQADSFSSLLLPGLRIIKKLRGSKGTFEKFREAKLDEYKKSGIGCIEGIAI